MAKSKSKSEKLEQELEEVKNKAAQAKKQEEKDALGTEIRLVRFYQSVIFERKLGFKQLSYNMDEFKNRSDMKMELNYDLRAVEITSAKDHVIVPLANIAFIQMFTEATRDAAIEARRALG